MKPFGHYALFEEISKSVNMSHSVSDTLSVRVYSDFQIESG